MEIKIETTFDSGTPLMTFSIKKQQYFINSNGAKQYTGVVERLGVVPGDFRMIEEFAPELLPVFKLLWTPEVIAAYQAESAAGTPQTQA